MEFFKSIKWHHDRLFHSKILEKTKYLHKQFQKSFKKELKNLDINLKIYQKRAIDLEELFK